jgi:hypothetical protein
MAAEGTQVGRRVALPYFDRCGTDLRSFLTLPTGFARSRPCTFGSLA